MKLIDKQINFKINNLELTTLWSKIDIENIDIPENLISRFGDFKHAESLFITVSYDIKSQEEFEKILNVITKFTVDILFDPPLENFSGTGGYEISKNNDGTGQLRVSYRVLFFNDYQQVIRDFILL